MAYTLPECFRAKPRQEVYFTDEDFIPSLELRPNAALTQPYVANTWPSVKPSTSSKGKAPAKISQGQVTFEFTVKKRFDHNYIRPLYLT